MSKLLRSAITLTIAGTILCTGPCFGQKRKERKLHKKARKELSLANYEGAKNLYLDLLEMDSLNPDYQFELGISYYNSYVDREKSIPHFESSLKLSEGDTIPEAVYYLGRAYQYVERFEDAIDMYNRFKHFMAVSKQGITLSRDVDRFIEMSNNGIEYLKETNEDIIISNLKEKVNSSSAEYAPVVKSDSSILIFTGRRRNSTGGKFYHDSKYYEDIYVSVDDGDDWGWATKFDSSSTYISSEINSKYHDAAIAFSEDEDKLFIYRQNHVWVSHYENGKWQAPEKMNKNINAGTHEPSVWITPDEQILFVTSNKEGGYGGRDIWISHKNTDGTWGALYNAGPEINTEFDEDAPFLSNDGKTFYFSSNGHTTMGGYDVFRATWGSDSIFTTPVNLGAPINTPGDDIYYIEDDEGTIAYYSSSRYGGLGDMDIYKITLACKNLPSTEVDGLIVHSGTGFPIGGKIVVYDTLGHMVYQTDIDRKTGEYKLVLPPKSTYKMEVFSEGDWKQDRPHRQTFSIPKQCDPYPLYQEVALRKLKNEEDQVIAQEALFQNAMFNAKDSAAALLGLDPNVTELNKAPLTDDSLQFNIAGNLRFNDALKVEEGVEVYLLNAQNEIIRTTSTDDDGNFNFNSLNLEQEVRVAFNEADLKNQYYGADQANINNGIIIQGGIKRTYRGNREDEYMDSLTVYLFDDEKNVLNLSQTDRVGDFTVDNVPDDQQLAFVKEINAQPVQYNINSTDLNFAVSAYIRTLNPEDNELYSEYIDIINIDLPVIDTVKPVDSITPVDSQVVITGPGPDLRYPPEFTNILFDFDKFFLRDQSKGILDKIYEYMVANPDATIQVDGHTDWKGTDQYNVKLSENRSSSAYNYLVSRGIDKSRINRDWFGEAQPTASNSRPNGSDDPVGRQLNRRCEFKIALPDMAFVITN